MFQLFQQTEHFKRASRRDLYCIQNHRQLRDYSSWLGEGNFFFKANLLPSPLSPYSWLEANVPIYYSQVATVLGPNLELAWTKTNETAIYISGKCSAHLAWLSNNLLRLSEWVRMLLLLAGQPSFVRQKLGIRSLRTGEKCRVVNVQKLREFQKLGRKSCGDQTAKATQKTRRKHQRQQ